MSKLDDVIIPFGKHKGKRLDDTPLLYLEWLGGQKPTHHYLFFRLLQAYLKEPVIVRELEKEEDKLEERNN